MPLMDRFRLLLVLDFFYFIIFCKLSNRRTSFSHMWENHLNVELILSWRRNTFIN